MINEANTQEQGGSWEEIWKRKNLMSAIINRGRYVYNGFFRKLLRKHLNKDTRILELGCGTSTLTISLSQEVSQIVGLDISPEAIALSNRLASEYAQQNNMAVSNAKFVLGDCLDIPQEYENAFDLVWSQGLMEHFENPLLVAQQHFLALRKGGVALISVPYRWSFYTPWYMITRPKLLRPLWPWTEQVFFTKKQLRRIGSDIVSKPKVYLLQPFFLGIVILELKKD